MFLNETISGLTLGVLQNIEKKPVNVDQVEYTLPDGSTKLLPLQDIHCHPGKWIDMTPMPAAPLCRVGTPKQDLGSVNMVEAPSSSSAMILHLMNHNLFVNSFLILSLCLLLFQKSKCQLVEQAEEEHV
jgi:hypothetical protein